VILQISSDPTMVENETLVRQRCTGNGGKLLDPYRAHGSHWWDLSLFNELSAPVIGIMSVREAHGFAAITGLARLCCEDSEQQAQNPITDIGASLKSAAARPAFVHLAMCAAATKQRNPINPPLGWVLSEATQGKFRDLLDTCGNDQELTTLGQALGVTFNRPKPMVSHGNAKPDRS
jgi:hypothetical protein